MNIRPLILSYVLGALGLVFAGSAPAQDNLLLTEFMAANGSTRADENGDYPDWIEIWNAGANTVNLQGWSLTDNSNRLAKWRFPATNLPPNAYLLVFASGKDRAIPGAPLHTSFNLSASGEYLALVDPATNVVSAYSPVFPRQAQDASFGIITSTEEEALIVPESPARLLVPADGTLGLDWTALAFDDNAWLPGTNGAGFDIPQVITDDFNTYHDYTGGNVAGTIWDGVLNAASLDATSDTTNGALHWRNTGEGWELANGSGPFLYKMVTGDFDAQVYVPYASTVQWSDGGLMARAPGATNGENWVSTKFFGTASSPGARWFLNGAGGNSGAFPAGDRYLRLARQGNSFTFYSRSSPAAAWTLGYTLSAPSLAGPLQVGLWHGTFSANAADRQYDDFVLTLGSTGEGALSYRPLVRTDLEAAMFGAGRASAYVRLPFQVADTAGLAQLTLRMRYDDGFVAWLNGTEVARRNAPAAPAFDSTAAAERTRAEALVPEVFDLSAFLSLLRPGANVLAVQGLNARANDSKFLVLPEAALRRRVAVEPGRWRYFAAPTPGAANGPGATVLGAAISQVASSPGQPGTNDPIGVTARVTPSFDPVTNVTLHYRVMFDAEIALPMFDDGAHGDGGQGDGVFGAEIPAATAGPGQMLRWYVTTADAAGAVSREPLFADPAVSPRYFGTVLPNPAVATALPVFQYFIENTNWYKLPNDGPFSKDEVASASISYLGRFYDNVRARIRGASMVLWKFPKQSLKFDFAPGQHFYYAANRELAEEINLNNFWTDKSYVRNYLSMEEVYRAAGVPSQDVGFLLACLNGDVQSVATLVEEPDERFLRRHGLDPAGAFYKMYNPCQEAGVRPAIPPGGDPDSVGGAEKKTRLQEDYSDLQALVDGIKTSNPSRSAFLFDNVNIPALINYCAASLVVQDWDRYPKNHFLFRDTTGTRLWQMIPWDSDLSWGYIGWMSDDMTATHATFSHPLYGQSDYPGPYSQWHVLVDACYRTPALRQMFLRRARTVLEQVLQAPGTPAAQLKLEARLDALYALMHSEVDADKQRYGTPFGASQTFLETLNLIKTSYLAARRAHLFTTQGPPTGLIPDTQFAYPAIHFGAINFNPASGNQAEEYLQLTNGNPFAVDLSGWQLDGAAQYAFPPGTVMPSNSALYLSPDVVAFRARTSGPRGGQSLFVLGNYQGQLSARGEALRLLDPSHRLVQTVNYAGQPSLAQLYLRITELMFNPAPLPGSTQNPQEFEYLELKNISATQTLDLNGVRLAGAIEFCFTGSALTNLGPGESVLVARNRAAFTTRFGERPNLAGDYYGGATNFLDNAGERVRLLDAAGEEILDFTFHNDWHGLAGGLGFSLVVRDEHAEPDAWNSRANWRPSAELGGSPGLSNPEPPAFAPVVINEVLTRTDTPPPSDSIELFNPAATHVNLGGWFLTDDFNTPGKYRIPDDTIIAPGGFLVFDESQFNPVPGTPPAFALSSLGDQVWLFSADPAGNLTGYAHGFDFGAAEDGVSFGRHVASTGEEHFEPQLATTLGATNAGPRIGPVVITEIMARPPGATNSTGEEFLELLNISASPVPLFDPLNPANTWRLTEAVHFVFPAGVTLAPGQYALVVNFDPAANAAALAAFLARYGLSSGALLFGPYEKNLPNSSGRIELKKPATPQSGVVPLVIVDRVQYDNAAPWPAGADGWGLSLQRRAAAAYGNDPANWTAAPPTPLAPSSGGLAPSIATQPASLVRRLGEPARFTVTATGSAPLGYQWQFNGENLPSATNDALSFSALQPAQAGEYQVLVFNSAGAVLSSKASLAVLIPPVITRQPASLALKPGQTAIFSVTAFSPSVSPLACQWRVNGAPLPGATNFTLTLTNIQPADAAIYTVDVSDAVDTVRSDPAVLNVIVAPRIGVQPVSQSVAAGGSVTFSVLLTNGSFPINYQWRVGNTPLTNFFLNSSASFFTLRNVQASQAGNYRVVITNAAQPGGLASSTAALTVLADADADGFPDSWTQRYFGHPTGQAADLSRPADDADSDGFSNWQEYVAGTDPTNALSYLKINSLTPSPGQATLEFLAVSNRSYTLQYTESLGLSPWLRLADVVVRTNSRLETVADPSASSNRFYRIVTPRQP